MYLRQVNDQNNLVHKLIYYSLIILGFNQHIHNLGNKQSIFLVDDLPSELDEENFLKCLELILDAPGQKFVSSIDPDFLGIKGRFNTLIAL